MKIEVLSFQELYDFLYQDDYDKFTHRISDHKGRLRYFNLDYKSEYVVAIENETIIGVLHYCPAESFSHNHFISYISVDSENRNKGISKLLVQKFKNDVLKIELGELGMSGYTELGFNYLKRQFDNFPVPVQNREIEF